MKKETYWSRFANDFEERNNYVVGKKDMDLVKEVVAKQKNLGKTLELGCGNGTFSKILLPNTTHLTATDYSDEMVTSTKHRLNGSLKLVIKKENCHQINFPVESFDSIFMANLLHIIPEPEKALSECERVLKKNGELIILSFTSENMSLFNKLRMTFRYLKTYGKPPETSYTLKMENAKNMLRQNGFQINKAEYIGYKMKAIFITGLKK